MWEVAEDRMVGQAEEDRVVEAVGDTRAEDRQEERQGVAEVVGDIIEGIQRGWLVDSPRSREAR